MHDELRERRETFNTILDSIPVADLKRPSHGTRWTNEELLFHMLFGYIVVVVLIGMIKLLGRLPRATTKPFAAVLNAISAPFNVVNYWGAVGGAKVYNHKRMGPKLDRVMASLLKRLDHASESTLRRGMYFPRRWDPFFKDYMTLAEVFHYPTQHFDFHLRQLALEP